MVGSVAAVTTDVVLFIASVFVVIIIVVVVVVVVAVTTGVLAPVALTVVSCGSSLVVSVASLVRPVTDADSTVLSGHNKVPSAPKNVLFVLS